MVGWLAGWLAGFSAAARGSSAGSSGSRSSSCSSSAAARAGGGGNSCSGVRWTARHGGASKAGVGFAASKLDSVESRQTEIVVIGGRFAFDEDANVVPLISSSGLWARTHARTRGGGGAWGGREGGMLDDGTRACRSTES